MKSSEPRTKVASDASQSQSTDSKTQQIADAIPAMVWTCRSDGHADFFNRKWYELTGQSTEESMGWGWADIIHPDDHERVQCEWQCAVEAGCDFEIEHRYKMSSGVYRWHLVRAVPVRDDDGNVDHWFGVCTDIDDRHESGEVSDAVTQAIVETVADSVITIDERGIIQFCNHATNEIFGYGGADLVGFNVEKLMPDIFQSTVRSSLAKFLKMGGSRTSRNIMGTREDGSVFPMEIAVSELNVRDYRLFTLIVRDITDRKRLEGDVRGQTRVLEQLAKGESLDVVLRTLVEAAESVRPEMIASILLVDEESGCLRHGASVRLPEFYVEAIDGIVPGPNAGSCGVAAFTAKRVIVEDVQTHPSWQDFREIAERAGQRACWSEPIISSTGTVLGTFAMYYAQPKTPDQSELLFVSNSARVAALAIEQSRAFEYQRQMTAAIESTDEAIFLQSVDFKIRSWNRAAERMYGYSSSEAIGKPARMLVPDDRIDELASISERLSNGETVDHFETIRVTKTGMRINVSLSISAVRDSDVPITHFVCIQNDISDRLAVNFKMAEKNAFLETIFNGFPDALFIADLDRRITRCSLGVSGVFGYEQKELIGQSASILYADPQEFQRQGDQRFNMDADDHFEAVEMEWRRKDGEVFHGEIVGTMIRDESNAPLGFLGFIRDITNRKQAEMLVRESQRKLSTLIDNLPGAAFRGVFGEHGAMEFVSDGCLQICGYTSAELQAGSPHWPEIIHADDIVRVRETIQESIAEETAFQTEYRILHRNGQERWIWEHGQFVSGDQSHPVVEGFAMDITEQRRAEFGLRESEHHYRSVVETAGSAVICVSTDEKITAWNSAAVRILGYSREEALGQNPFELLLDKDLHSKARSIANKVNRGQSVHGHEFPFRTRDGGHRVLLWNSSCLLGGNDDPIGRITVGQDITELKAAQEKLVQSERLAAMGQMMSSIAHESRNALQRIQAGVDMLKLDIPEGTEAAGDLAQIAMARNDLLILLDGMRDFAAPVILDLQKCNLADVWRQSWRNLVHLRKDRPAELVEETDGIDPQCTIDSFRMEQIFRNLIENSFAACSGPIKISITCTDCELKSVPAMRISVRDNGPGLTEEQQKRIFDAFYTTKPKGTGLGMAIAMKTVTAHHGTLTARNGDGGGAEFVITLPRKQNQ